MSVSVRTVRSGRSATRVAQVWRYPVKSMQGESLAALDVEADRLPGDREWCVRDSQTGDVLNARTTRVLLQASSVLGPDGTVAITFPDGRCIREDDPLLDLALASLVGRPAHLAHAADDEVATISAPVSFEDDRSPLGRWRSLGGTFNDGHPVHLVTTASLRAAARLHPTGAWDPRRFRPNLVLDVGGDDFVEESWSGLQVGDVALEIYKRATRCAITARAQPGLPDDLGVPRALARNREAKLGVYARVRSPGTIEAGAVVHPT